MNFIITVSIIFVGILWIGMMFGSLFVKIIESIFPKNKNKRKRRNDNRRLHA